ncbi:hypothetical protein [Brevibacterium aurantiacum]|uniref:DNA polymerase-1 n=1 Tax=Brevibacterium aurantiacum TaxID=273384 RepID=A0A2H1K534_BREAU|nr:hypothetical protein [Brevibacterium aurantiacum]SMX94917.1 DNA polymerase-1 [Brevibacterium aurantiacum]
MTNPSAAVPAWCVIGRAPDSALGGVRGMGSMIAVVDLDDARQRIGNHHLGADELPTFVREREAQGRPRWVFSDTPNWYPALLVAGVQIERCYDLRLTHAILMRSELVADRNAVASAEEWDAGPVSAPTAPEAEALFEVTERRSHIKTVPHDIESALAEFARQSTALQTASDPGRLRLLLAAESAGGLVAAEMQAAGVPWDIAEHDRILSEKLGPRPAGDAKPAKMLAVAEEVRAALDGGSRRGNEAADLLGQQPAAALITVKQNRAWT